MSCQTKENTCGEITSCKIYIPNHLKFTKKVFKVAYFKYAWIDLTWNGVVNGFYLYQNIFWAYIDRS